MYIVLGGTGHVGSAVASTLIARSEPVTIVTRDAAKAAPWKQRGADIAFVDLRDTAALRDVLRTGARAFLLNPPASPATDTDAAERETVRQILAAVAGSGLEKIVAQSTYGAQPGERLGDLNTLHDLETGLQAQAIPTAILRAAYYFTNWDASLDAVREGTLPTMLPADLALPMASPDDLGRLAADLLMGPVAKTGVFHAEGPARYSPADVAAAFAAALGRPVLASVIPRDDWEAAFRKLGFSAPAAQSYARMTAVTVDGGFALPDDPLRGTVTLQDHIAALVARADG